MNTVITVFQLLSAIIAALKALEEAIPGASQGEAKLAALRAMLEAIDGGVAKLWPQIEAVVKVLVKSFNDNGTFIKK